MPVHTSTYDPSPLSADDTGRRLSSYLATTNAEFPSAWRECAVLHEQGRTSLGWPDWCWLPTLEALPVVFGSALGRRAAMLTALRSMPWSGNTLDAVVALAKWRLGKVVLRFDEPLARALDETDGIDTAPADSLLRLPAWCVYVIHDRSDFFGRHLRGWFAHLDLDLRTRRPVLRLLFDVDRPKDGKPDFLVGSMFLDRTTLTDGVLDWLALPDELASGWLSQQSQTSSRIGHAPSTALGIQAALAKVAPCVARLLYVASEAPDLRNIDDPDATLSAAGPGSPRKPWTAAPYPTTWDVGYRIGSALRSASASAHGSGSGGDDETGRTVRPHLRRAHWHTFWVGPKRAERRVRWMMPTLVNAPNPDGLVTVERFVADGA